METEEVKEEIKNSVGASYPTGIQNATAPGGSNYDKKQKNGSLIKGIIIGILAGLAIPVLIFGTLIFFNVGNLGNLVEAVEILDNNALHTLSFSEKVEGAVSGIIDGLDDKYSYYLDAEEYADLMDEVSGDYEGLGIYLVTEEGAEYTEVMSPIKGSPAYEAGILAGDKIISINGEDMSGVAADVIANKIKRGEETHFVMEVERDGETLTFEMDREVINLPSVEGQWFDEDTGIAYITITSFTNQTASEFHQVIYDLEDDGEIKGLLLDLRNNPGGSVPAVIDVADVFLKQDDHILWVEERNDEECYDATGSPTVTCPVVVLVNENSASASEILSGALKENGVATLVGTVTFGKGIIQTIYPVSGGAAVKVTTAEYLSPDKNTIHEVGVSPDIEVELEGDDPTVVYSLDMSLDNQLKAGYDTLKEMLQ